MSDPELKILVVDDSDINLKISVTVLKSFGYKILSALSAKTAIDIVKRKRPDMILMDYLMPEMNGIEATKAIRCLAQNPKDYFGTVPIIALSAEDLPELQQLFKNAGMNDFLMKPLAKDAIQAVFRKYFPDFSPIPGIDPETADALMKADSDELCELLSMFISDTAGKIKRISEAEKSADYEAYTVDVHRLKSEAKMIGASLLSEKAKELELIGKSITGVIDNGSTLRQNKLLVSELTQPLLSELISLSANIKAYLDSRTKPDSLVSDTVDSAPNATNIPMDEAGESLSVSEADVKAASVEDKVKASKARARARSEAARVAKEAEAEKKAAEAANTPKNPKEEKIIRYVGYAKDALAKGDTALAKNWLDEILEVINDA